MFPCTILAALVSVNWVSDSTPRLGRTIPFPECWIGRRVWVNGSIAYGTRHRLAVWNMLEPVVIIKAETVSSDEQAIVPGPPIWEAMTGSGPLECEAREWHVITLRLPNSARVSGGDENSMWFSVTHKALHKYKDHPIAEEAQILAVDEGHLRMQVSLTPSWHDLIKEPVAVQRAFKQRQPLKGMTRSMIVRLLGYPSYLKSPSEQERQDFWLWDGPSMHSYGVHFGADNRVTWRGKIYYELP